jgi:hypothetical protein
MDDAMNARSTLIAVLLLAILGFGVAAIAQGHGDYLLGLLLAVGFWSLLGLLFMLRWTISLQFWSGLGTWLRNRRQ